MGKDKLRPLQIAYESRRFMLPIRLGTLNADGDQELFVYTLTRKGRVQSTNYRTVKLPTGKEIPAYVKTDFARFYQALFKTQKAIATLANLTGWNTSTIREQMGAALPSSGSDGQ